MDKGLVVVAVGFLVLASGCVQTGAGGKGVVVEDFSPSFSEVYPGEPVRFTVKIRNTGSFDASGTVSIAGMDEWGCKEKKTFSLLAPDREKGIEGGSKVLHFDCTAPDVPEGSSIVYHPVARVDYEYQASMVKTVTLVSGRELKSLMDSGRPVPAETKSVSEGPVSLDVVFKGPVRYWDSGSVSFPFEVVVSNVGGGTVFWKDKMNEVNIEIKSEGSLIDKCSSGVMELWEGKEARITCMMVVDINDANNAGQIQKELRVNALFNYLYEKTGSIRVVWRQKAQQPA